MNWPYFDLVLTTEESDVYKLVDEDGQPLLEDGALVLFTGREEADRYLRDEGIRGDIR